MQLHASYVNSLLANIVFVIWSFLAQHIFSHGMSIQIFSTRPIIKLYTFECQLCRNISLQSNLCNPTRGVHIYDYYYTHHTHTIINLSHKRQRGPPSTSCARTEYNSPPKRLKSCSHIAQHIYCMQKPSIGAPIGRQTIAQSRIFATEWLAITHIISHTGNKTAAIRHGRADI